MKNITKIPVVHLQELKKMSINRVTKNDLQRCIFNRGILQPLFTWIPSSRLDRLTSSLQVTRSTNWAKKEMTKMTTVGVILSKTSAIIRSSWISTSISTTWISWMLTPPNKLKKLIVHHRLTGLTMSKDVTPERGSLNVTSTGVPKPLTVTEQYWATRALKAEALLVAQDNYRKEFKTMEHAQDMKREVLSLGVQSNAVIRTDETYSVKWLRWLNSITRNGHLGRGFW